MTNKLLAKKASVICVAYDGMEKYFPAEKIIKTGNPVRQNFDNLADLKEALEFFNLRKICRLYSFLEVRWGRKYQQKSFGQYRKDQKFRLPVVMADREVLF